MNQAIRTSVPCLSCTEEIDDMTATPQGMIDGSWYEYQYRTPGSRYRGIYDKPNPHAKDLATARYKWNRVFALPNLR